MSFTTDGVVIKITKTGESDRLLYILSRGRGVIKAFAKSANRPKNKLHSSTNLFCYSNFTFYEGKTALKVTESEVKETFFGLTEDLKNLALAQYFSDLAVSMIPESVETDDILRLHLNSLYFLSKKLKKPETVKPVYEMRLMSDIGYMPGLVACAKCGKFETPVMNFDPLTGILLCSDCADNHSLDLPLNVISAMRQICYADLNMIFSLKLSDENLSILNNTTEKYLLNRSEKNFRTLRFYNSL